MPLSFVIARYFAYAFAAVATAWLASFMALSAAINAGFVYEASWGPANAREVAEGLARDGVCGQQDAPTRPAASASGAILREITRLARRATSASASALPAAAPTSMRFCGLGSSPARSQETHCGRYSLTSAQAPPPFNGTAS